MEIKVETTKFTQPIAATFVFSSQGYYDEWLVKITPDGHILFNKEAYPAFTFDDFAKAFIHVVEKHIIKK